MKKTPRKSGKSSKTSSPLRFEVKLGAPDFAKVAAHALTTVNVLAVYQDNAQKAMAPKGAIPAAVDLIEKLRKTEAYTAKAGTISFLRFAVNGGTESLLLVGGGKPAGSEEEKFRQAGGQAWARILAEKCDLVRVNVSSFVDVSGLKTEHSPVRLVRAFAEGMALAAYDYRGLKTDAAAKKPLPSVKVEFYTKDTKLKNELQSEVAEVAATAIAVALTRDWSNLPSNIGTPTYYADQASQLARQFGLKVRILTEKDCVREKMGLFLGVGQGSKQEVRLVVVEYVPAKAKKKLCLVGKGVTFDSGGISIKPGLRMEDMKHDMTGAATVLGATVLASLWGSAHHVIAVMAFAENMPDGGAINPGNVLTSRSGKTVEVLNTDAEGRLILGDALDFAQDMKPDAIVDVATLTGAVSVALGKYACAILGNDEEFIQQVQGSGSTHSERIWELPLWDDYFDDMRSDVADMRNVANDANGGTIRGAIFLKQFIRPGQAWAHLDIASTAYGLTHLPYLPKKGASGLYVRTLAQLAMDL